MILYLCNTDDKKKAHNPNIQLNIKFAKRFQPIPNFAIDYLQIFILFSLPLELNSFFTFWFCLFFFILLSICTKQIEDARIRTSRRTHAYTFGCFCQSFVSCLFVYLFMYLLLVKMFTLKVNKHVSEGPGKKSTHNGKQKCFDG